MPNRSKIADGRFWRRWWEAGALVGFPIRIVKRAVLHTTKAEIASWGRRFPPHHTSPPHPEWIEAWMD